MYPGTDKVCVSVLNNGRAIVYDREGNEVNEFQNDTGDGWLPRAGAQALSWASLTYNVEADTDHGAFLPWDAALLRNMLPSIYLDEESEMMEAKSNYYNAEGRLNTYTAKGWVTVTPDPSKPPVSASPATAASTTQNTTNTETPMSETTTTTEKPAAQGVVDFTKEVVIDSTMMAMFQKLESVMYKRMKRRAMKKWPELALVMAADEGLADRILQTLIPYMIRQAATTMPAGFMGIPASAIDGLRVAAEYAIRGNMYKNADIMMEFVMPFLLDFAGMGEAVASNDAKKIMTMIASAEEDALDANELEELRTLAKERVAARR